MFPEQAAWRSKAVYTNTKLRSSRDSDARIELTQVQYVNAHGTSTGLGDKAETLAIKHAFGEHAKKLAVGSTKSMTGHLLGGARGLEAGLTVLALRDQVAPPTINYEFPDPDCDLDYVANKAAPCRSNTRSPTASGSAPLMAA